MKVRFNYYLKIKSIMGKEYDEFEVSHNDTLKNILYKNIDEDKMNQIDFNELLIICDGKNIDDINMVVENDIVFSICPKIYGG